MIGPYQLLGPLGQGAVGAVSRARHVQTGQVVALKTLEIAWEAHLPTLRREIHALARTVHPGVVRILDSGAEQGLPWLAMELIEGLDLRAWARSLGPPAALPPGAPVAPALLVVFARLCQALAYLHGEGILHRDLKPENVLVRQMRVPAGGQREDEPVLVDFGLATHFAGSAGRERLEIGSEISGALYTMAPELIRGEMPDARADLYAVGCMLHEALAGRPPFEGATVREVLHAHLHTPAPAPPGLPPALQALLNGLLAKDPRDRIGYAQDVAAALLAMTDREPIGPELPEPRPYLYQPRLSGRGDALRDLGLRVESLQQGRSGIALLGGESGAGKTRLVMEAARAAERQGIHVLCGECLGPAQDAGSPLEALRRPLQAVADRCRERGRRETERLLGRHGGVLALYEPGLIGLPGLDLPPAGALRDAPLPPEAALLRLYAALSDTFVALSRATPLLLVLDDLHWADSLTLGWLDFLLRTDRLAAERVLLLGTCRTEEAGTELRGLLRDPRVGQLRLDRLDETATSEVIADMLAADPPPVPLVRFLTRECEGNPFFIGEYLRSAVGERLLGRDSRGRWEARATGFDLLPPPRSILALVGRRLSALDAESLALAEAASVLGRDAEGGLLASVSGLAEGPLWTCLEELLTRHVLDEAQPDRFRFAHDKIREAAYAGIPAGRRAELHGRAARALEALSETERCERLGALGHHWEQAGDLGRAQDRYLAGARRAAASYAQAEAERLFSAFLRLASVSDPEAVEARIELAEQVFVPGGRREEALEQYGRACEDAERLGLAAQQARSLLGQASLHREGGDMEAARRLAEQSLEGARRIGSGRLEGGALNELAVIASQQSRFEQASGLLHRALDLHRGSGDNELEGVTYSNLAGIAWNQGRLAEARGFCEQALAAHRRAGDRRSEAGTLGNLANLCRRVGDLGQARALVEEAIAIHREIGHLADEAGCLNTLASILWDQDEPPETVRAAFELALERQRALGQRRDMGGPLLNLAELARLEGRLAAAREGLEQALALHREVGDRMLEGLAEAKLALLHLEAGRQDEAWLACTHALELLEQVQGHLFLPYALLSLAILERRTGDVERAGPLLDRAEAGFERLGSASQRLNCVCERGHLALARGRPPRPHLEQAQALAALARPQRPARDRVARLQGAVEAAEAGGKLWRGERAEDLPEGRRAPPAGVTPRLSASS